MKFNHNYILGFAKMEFDKDSNYKILDYGCGAGEVVIMGREMGMNIFGVDVFYEGSGDKPIVEKSGLFGTIITEIVGGKIDFPSGYFDLVVCNQVMEHVEDLDKVLVEINRVLKPGGSLLSLMPSREVWRENHCGIPFLHRFPKSSKFRYPYALF